VDQALALQQAFVGTAGIGWERLTQHCRHLLGQSMSRDRAEIIAVTHNQSAFRDPAEGVCLLQYCVEYRGKIAGRGVDDLQYLSRRGLLLQGLARLGQEPRVFHRDHRLGCEILQERDLLFGERADFLTVDHYEPEQRVVLAQRHSQ
jgi:hypothetical protein